MHLLVWLIVSIVFILILRYYFRKKEEKDEEFHYQTSRYWGKENFPIKLNLVDSGQRIQNDLRMIKRAASSINDFMKFKFFDTNVSLSMENDVDGVLNVHISYSDDENKRLDGVGGVLGFAILPPNMGIYIDAAEKWNDVKFYRVMKHELGHSLGLHHSLDKESIMYFELLQKITDFTNKDYENLYTLYPFIL